MTKSTFRENLLRVVAVVGLIAVLLLGAWGIIQLAFFIPGFLSDLANGSLTRPVAKETLTASAPLAVTSGQAFPLAWSLKNGIGQYGYTVSYACAQGLSVKAPLPNGTLQEVACNTPFNYLNATTTTPIVATATGDKAIAANFTVTATKLSTSAVVATASVNTSVAPPAKAPAKPAATTPTKSSTNTNASYVASGRTTNLWGYPDLQVRITSNPGTVHAGQLVKLQFVIENVGTNVTPHNWSFTAALPYVPTYTYQSQGQQALYPGDKIVYTLSYNAAYPQNNNTVCTLQYPNYNCPTQQYPYDTNYQWSQPFSTMGGDYDATYGYYPPGYQYPGYAQSANASINVDPYNYVWESNEFNNNASITYTVY
jgi:hypothetical protein